MFALAVPSHWVQLNSGKTTVCSKPIQDLFLNSRIKMVWSLKANVSQENQVLCHVLRQFSIALLQTTVQCIYNKTFEKDMA